MHWIPLALDFDFAMAGRSMPARMAMIAMTTSSSIKVKADVADEGEKADGAWVNWLGVSRSFCTRGLPVLRFGSPNVCISGTLAFGGRRAIAHFGESSERTG